MTTTVPAHILPHRPAADRRWRVALTLLAVISVLLVLSLLAVQSTTSWWLNKGYPPAPATEVLAGAESVTLDAHIGDVEVVVGDVSEPTLGLVHRGSQSLPEGGETARARIEVSGSAAHPHVDVSQPATTGPVPWEDDRSQVLLVLPDSASIPVEVTTGAGDVTLTGIGGAVSATTSAGDVTITEIPEDSQVTASTQVGDVRLEVLEASQTSSVDVTTELGDITAVLPTVGRWTIEAASPTGDVTISPGLEAVPTDGPSPALTARSEVGDIDVTR